MEDTKRAMIYVRGEAEAEQELFCSLHALKRDYDIIGTVKDLE